MLSLAERYTHDGKVIGIEEGITIGMEKGKIELASEVELLYEKGIDPNEIICRVISKLNS